MSKNNKFWKTYIKPSLAILSGSLVGGVVGNKIGNKWSKSELEELKLLTDQFMERLKRQPRMYSLYTQLTKYVKSSTLLEDGEEKENHKKIALKLTQKFLIGLTDHDKKLYLQIQNLTDKVYDIQKNSVGIGLTLGGVIGLIISTYIK